VPKKSDDQDEFRLRPHRPPKSGKNESIAWATALKTVFRYASTSSRRRKANQSDSSAPRPRKQFNQRCAVRITYTKNKVTGQWRAHGRYIVRESAARDGGAAFNDGAAAVEPAQALDRWQKQGDARLWKFIVSPEFGDRIDLQRLTRELMGHMEKDLGTRLEWVGVSHFNTEHAHTHVALRGVRDDGSVLDLPRDYVKTGIRTIAEDLCTRQMGYRTELDALAAERREIGQSRVTSLDRIISRASAVEDNSGSKGRFSIQPALAATKQDQIRHLEARLIFLEKMDLANQAEPGTWSVRADFLTVLKAMQQVGDRQRMLAAHQALVSDERLPLVVTEQRSIKHLEGRVLGHGEDDDGKNFGRHYMLLEGTDAKIHLIYYTPELEEARSRGQLGVNSFIRLQKGFENGRPMMELERLGNSEKLLENTAYFRKKAGLLSYGGAAITAEAWGGWLGRYRDRLTSAAIAAERAPGTWLER
jgi:type IV secretory pathway VirD2 relaxase